MIRGCYDELDYGIDSDEDLGRLAAPKYPNVFVPDGCVYGRIGGIAAVHCSLSERPDMGRKYKSAVDVKPPESCHSA